jgi:hypothetical protein
MKYKSKNKSASPLNACIAKTIPCNKIICKVILSSLSLNPYKPSQWYPQSKEILLNLSMKYWN